MHHLQLGQALSSRSKAHGSKPRAAPNVQDAERCICFPSFAAAREPRKARRKRTPGQARVDELRNDVEGPGLEIGLDVPAERPAPARAKFVQAEQRPSVGRCAERGASLRGVQHARRIRPGSIIAWLEHQVNVVHINLREASQGLWDVSLWLGPQWESL